MAANYEPFPLPQSPVFRKDLAQGYKSNAKHSLDEWQSTNRGTLSL